MRHGTFSDEGREYKQLPGQNNRVLFIKFCVVKSVYLLWDEMEWRREEDNEVQGGWR